MIIVVHVIGIAHVPYVNIQIDHFRRVRMMAKKDLLFTVKISKIDPNITWEQIRDSLEDVLQVDLIKGSLPGKSIEVLKYR